MLSSGTGYGRRAGLPVLLALALLLGGCASSAERIRQRREITTRVLPVPYGAAFAGTLAVLQDNGFVLEVVDRRSGLVRAVKSEQVSLSTVGRAVGAVLGSGEEERLNDGHTYHLSCVVSPEGDERTEVRVLIIREPPASPEAPGAVKSAVRVAAKVKGWGGEVEEDPPENYYHRPAYTWFLDSVQLEAARIAGLGAAAAASAGWEG